MAQLLQDDLEFFAPAPGPVRGVTAQTIGRNGSATYYYWWVTHFPIGAIVSGPIMIRQAPDVLSVTNYVIVTGTPSLGAISYDLLRTSQPVFPSVSGNMAVAIGLSSPTFNDQSLTLQPYNPTGLPFGAPVSAHINLNNRDYSRPTLVVAPVPLAIQQLIFPDGTSQSSAATGGGTGNVNGPSTTTVGNVPTWANTTGTLLSTGFPASATSIGAQSLVLANLTGQIDISYTPQIYSWQQDVQANAHNLLGLTGLAMSNPTATSILSVATGAATSQARLQLTTPSSSYFIAANTSTPSANCLLIGDQNANLPRIIVTPAANGDVVIGTGTTATDTINLRNARLQVYVPTGYPLTSTTSMIACYQNQGGFPCRLVLETGSGGGSPDLTLVTTAKTYRFSLSNTNLIILDVTLARNVISITNAGVGLSTGAALLTTHLFELSADDAFKPTTNTWTITSDIRTKRNVRQLQGGLEVIRALEPIEAEYNGSANTPEGSRVVSFHPEHLRKILPGAVSSVRGKLRDVDEEETDILGVNTHEILHHLVLAVQQLDRTISSGWSDKSASRKPQKHGG